MHLDIGTIVWLIVVLAGVIGSLRKNSRKANVAKPPAAPAAVARRFDPEPPVVTVPVPRVISTPAPATVAPPAAVPVAPPMPAVRPIGTSPVRGMFEGPATLVRAIVAAEVLGPPKSMQEQSIWSPRHSEPSI